MKVKTYAASILLGTVTLFAEASNNNLIERGEQMALPEVRISPVQSTASEHRVSSMLSQLC